MAKHCTNCETYMSDVDQTNRLLAEIRDLMASREQQYKEHLMNCERAYAEQVKAVQQTARRRRALELASLFVVIYGAVYFALTSAG